MYIRVEYTKLYTFFKNLCTLNVEICVLLTKSYVL